MTSAAVNDSSLEKVNLIALLVFCVFALGFLFAFDHPLNTDLPFHASIAKALVDLSFYSPDLANYPYELNLQLSSYSLSQLILASFIAAAGLVTGSKLALFAWMLAYAVTTNKMVSLLNGSKTPLAYIGYPLAFSYFFHWGFWPFMVGMVFANLCIIADRSPNNRHPILTGSLLRFLTFLCHPVPVLIVGIYDLIFTFFPNKKSFNPKDYAWVKMTLFWIPAFLLLLWMLRLSEHSIMVYGEPFAQIKALTRGLTPWGGKIGILVSAGILGVCFFLVFKNFRIANSKVLICGVVLSVLGVLIPREAFMGSWACSERITLFGIIFLFAAINATAFKKGLLATFVAGLFAVNFLYSVIAWNYFDKHVAQIIDYATENKISMIEQKTDNNQLSTVPYRQLNSVATAANIELWLWSLGLVQDATNYVAKFPYGPVRYKSLNSEQSFTYYYVYSKGKAMTPEEEKRVRFKTDVFLLIEDE